MIIGIRFIPAGAGNTSYSRKCLGDDPVYPRWRGEHILILFSSAVLAGLSPLARGTHIWYLLSTLPLKSVYPRWRGEHYNWRVLVSL
ncbi:hypothetical protein SA34_0754 [Salmonella enterica subsp. enterica serovar Agona str. 34.H.09]|nr:hypothetical protein SA34_0754 [Salmonella enterica subsp. enterica serovar Agona str. 34.H.09]